MQYVGAVCELRGVATNHARQLYGQMAERKQPYSMKWLCKRIRQPEIWGGNCMAARTVGAPRHGCCTRETGVAAIELASARFTRCGVDVTPVNRARQHRM